MNVIKHFAFVLRQQPLDQGIGDTGKAEWVDQGERRRDLASIAVKLVQGLAEFVRKGAALHVYFE